MVEAIGAPGKSGSAGVFGQWQPVYAEHKLAAFPIAADKRPAIRGYLKIGLNRSASLVDRFGKADALGIAVGARSKITVLDIDTSDERVLADALALHGNTPLKVRTGGGFHCYYRHAGERRRIRPFRDKPLDVLGAGYVVAPPSRAAGGRTYEILEGGRLDDLDRLPRAAGLAGGLDDPSPLDLTAERIPTGERNTALFRHLMRAARGCDSLDDLLDVARTFSDLRCTEPLPDSQVIAAARSAWGYEQRGENKFGQPGVWFSSAEALPMITGNPDGFLLLSFLRAANGPNSTFMVANGLADRLDWTRKRLAGARARLVASGQVVVARNAGRSIGAALYRWPGKGWSELTTYPQSTSSFSELAPAEQADPSKLRGSNG